MGEDYFQQLVERYAAGICTDAELEVFFHLLAEGKLDQYLLVSMNDTLGLEQESARIVPVRQHSAWWKRWPAAAAILLLAGSAAYLTWHRASTQHHAMAQATPVQPGSNNAVLTLSNGHTIILNHATTGSLLASEGKASIRKTDSGLVVYALQGQAAYAQEWNTLRTPAGGQFAVVLSDGTRAWLNACSSIHYPAAFGAGPRQVDITGEVYFEVAAGTQSFTVSSQGSLVEVLGTRFNVNAYTDEPTLVTTLLEGRVRVSAGGHALLLQPGQQALGAGGLLSLQVTDTANVMAWKEGYFQFTNADLSSMMRQVARWYNVKVEYADTYKERKFSGGIPRTAALPAVLDMLRYAGIEAVLQDHTIIITR